MLVILDVLFTILCMIECSGDLEASYSAVPKILNQLVLADVRSKMSLVLADEKRAREEFLSRNEQQNTAEANADKRKLT